MANGLMTSDRRATPDSQPQIRHPGVPAEMVQHLGLQEFSRGNRINQGVVGGIVRQPITQPAISQANRHGLLPQQLLPA